MHTLIYTVDYQTTDNSNYPETKNGEVCTIEGKDVVDCLQKLHDKEFNNCIIDHLIGEARQDYDEINIVGLFKDITRANEFEEYQKHPNGEMFRESMV